MLMMVRLIVGICLCFSTFAYSQQMFAGHKSSDHVGDGLPAVVTSKDVYGKNIRYGDNHLHIMSADVQKNSLYVSAFGADSSGVKDSTAAIVQAINFAVNSQIPSDIIFDKGTYLINCSNVVVGGAILL